jgi:mono/diheme cytochrome c family protein
MKTNYSKTAFALFILCTVFILSRCTQPQPEVKEEPKQDPVARGKYLVTIGGCDDCHSPKIFTAKGPVPDTTRLLSGHPESMPMPKIDTSLVAPGKWAMLTQDLTMWVGPWGVSFPANLTPDSATGTGAWTADLFKKILRSGKHMGAEASRPILPPMPWYNYAAMTDEDLEAIFAYLHSLPPIHNKVPDPIAPQDIMKMGSM